MTTTAQFTPTSQLLPPEGIEVLTKHFEFSNPVPLTREGDSWLKTMDARRGKFRFCVNYQPVSWKKIE